MTNEELEAIRSRIPLRLSDSADADALLAELGHHVTALKAANGLLDKITEERDAALLQIGDLKAKMESVNQTLIHLGLEPLQDRRSVMDGQRPWEQHISMILSSLALTRGGVIQKQKYVCLDCGKPIEGVTGDTYCGNPCIPF
jgi:hypothetical protein